jgi:dihydroxyacetone kinase
MSKNNASGGGFTQTGTAFNNKNKLATGFFLVDHLESKSAVLLHTPLTCEKEILQSIEASNNHKFLAIVCNIGSLPLLEFKMLTATVLSHHIVTNFEDKRGEMYG